MLRSLDWPRGLGAHPCREPTKSPVQIRPAPPLPQPGSGSNPPYLHQLMSKSSGPIVTILHADCNTLGALLVFCRHALDSIQARAGLSHATIRMNLRGRLSFLNAVLIATNARPVVH